MVNFTADQLRQIASQLLTGHYLRTMTAAVAHEVSVGGVPGLGSGMNDTYTASDNVDGTHPLNIRYVIAANTQRINSARLSFHLGPYRTYSNFTVSNTATETTDHNHPHTHGAHGHSVHVIALGGTPASIYSAPGSPWLDNVAAGAYDIVPGTNNTTPTSDATGRSSNHSHSISGSSFLGVAEGATAAAVAITFDGVDQTTALGGPWSVDVIEMDIRSVLATTPGTYHTIALQPTGLGRIEAHLRLGAYVDARLP